jgi:hypothetical protein
LPVTEEQEYIVGTQIIKSKQGMNNPPNGCTLLRLLRDVLISTSQDIGRFTELLGKYLLALFYEFNYR